MSLVSYSFTAILASDAIGANVVAGQPVTVAVDFDGSTVDIWQDESGTIPLSNPSNTDSSGNLKFWIEPGIYTITSGSRVETHIIDNAQRTVPDSVSDMINSKHLRVGDLVTPKVYA